eukprot:5962713-Pyramimonas_sp.AAC.1
MGSICASCPVSGRYLDSIWALRPVSGRYLGSIWAVSGQYLGVPSVTGGNRWLVCGTVIPTGGREKTESSGSLWTGSGAVHNKTPAPYGGMHVVVQLETQSSAPRWSRWRSVLSICVVR